MYRLLRIILRYSAFCFNLRCPSFPRGRACPSLSVDATRALCLTSTQGVPIAVEAVPSTNNEVREGTDTGSRAAAIKYILTSGNVVDSRGSCCYVRASVYNIHVESCRSPFFVLFRIRRVHFLHYILIPVSSLSHGVHCLFFFYRRALSVARQLARWP